VELYVCIKYNKSSFAKGEAMMQEFEGNKKDKQVKTIITILLMIIVLVVLCLFYHDRIKHRKAFSKTIRVEQLEKPKIIKGKTGNKEKYGICYVIKVNGRKYDMLPEFIDDDKAFKSISKNKTIKECRKRLVFKINSLNWKFYENELEKHSESDSHEYIEAKQFFDIYENHDMNEKVKRAISRLENIQQFKADSVIKDNLKDETYNEILKVL
jgi:hypothetical protein